MPPLSFKTFRRKLHDHKSDASGSGAANIGLEDTKVINFNGEHLDIIHDCAAKCARTVPTPNELAVFDLVQKTHGNLFGAELLNLLRFCATEVEHQNEGAKAVYNYAKAWSHAIKRREDGYSLNLQTLSELAAMIEPIANPNGGYRTREVFVGSMPIGTDPEYIERDMAGFEADLLAYDAEIRVDYYGRPLTARRLYIRLQQIHPRINGNGREGKILYNWLMGTLEAPQFPREPKDWKFPFD